MKLSKLLIACLATASVTPLAANAGADTMAGIFAESCVGEDCGRVSIEREATEVSTSNRTGTRANTDLIPGPFSLVLRRNSAGLFEISLTGLMAKTARPAGETCIVFSAAAAKLRLVRGEWSVVDGRHRIKGFGNKQRDAQDALNLIRAAQADQLCLGGRLSVVAATARR